MASPGSIAPLAPLDFTHFFPRALGTRNEPRRRVRAVLSGCGGGIDDLGGFTLLLWQPARLRARGGIVTPAC
jgi:hypothetical protein